MAVDDQNRPYPPGWSTTTRSPQRLSVVEIELDRLESAGWNPNRASDAVCAKLRRSFTDFGIVENLVVRPHPKRPSCFEVISGNYRLPIYRELGLKAAPCHVVELNDAYARVLAQTLNRTRGTDDPQAYARLVEEVLAELSLEQVLGYLPESEHAIDRLLAEHGSGDPTRAGAELAPEPPAAPESTPGELYELGPHRLLCGDATDPAQVAALMQREQPTLMATDPPYGISLDHTWRDGVRQPLGSARSGSVANDDRCDWREAYLLTSAPVAYLWHSALHSRVAADSLEAAGFEIRQQIVWEKCIHTLSRAHYQWRHECCWYAVRTNASASWRGDRDQTTIWRAPSPIMAYGRVQDDAVTSHPTQKPLLLFEKPIRNHTKHGDVVYEPFAGSGTQLIAAERLGRRCFALELDPAYCDVIRKRYEAYKGDAEDG
jgi:DNA modification methylase